MNDLFGISMTLIMWVLLAITAAALASVGIVALRNSVMFKIGVRNIPRRRAQTVLIVLGLMLSTLIISAAFTTGDTVDRSMTGEVYAVLGSLDQTIARAGGDTDTFDSEVSATFEPGFSEADARLVRDRLMGDPLFDAVVPLYSNVTVALNLERRLSSPVFNLVGLDAAAARDLPDIRSLEGGRVLYVDELGRGESLSIAELDLTDITGLAERALRLRPGEIYINRSAADELDARAGDTIYLIALGRVAPFRVKEIVEDRRLAGAGGFSIRREGGVVALPVAQELFDLPGRVSNIAVSNEGDAREGVRHAAAAKERIRSVLRTTPTETPLAVFDTKKQAVDLTTEAANVMTTLFLVFGLFSIGAGMLLIFMIFVMLAAERKPEMGMARAIGTKRADLVQMFLSEGMAYNLAAAMVGTALGVGVAFVIARIMASIFAQFDINISSHVTARSLVISYCLGVALTFLTVTFSSWRVSVINIVRAVRDIPEPPVPRPQWRAHGFWGTLRALLVKPGGPRAWGFRLGLLVLSFAGQGVAASGGPTAAVIFAGLVGALAFLAFIFLSFQFGPLFLIGSIPLLYFGVETGSLFLVMAGLSLLPLGLGLTVRSFGANERLVYSLAGAFLLYIWELDNLRVAGVKAGLRERIFGELEGDIEMFFLSGVMITVASTFVIVYNADALLGLFSRLGRRLGVILPSIKMAIAYPLASRSRTGLTIAMFTLVVFALVVMSSINYNFEAVFLSERALGGWDVTVDENPSAPIADLKGTLAAAGSPAAGKIDAVARVAIVSPARAAFCQPGPSQACALTDFDAWDGYQVRGVDETFLSESRIPLQHYARGYASEAEVWAALARDPTLALVDPNAVDAGGFGGPALFRLRDFENKDGFEPPVVLMIDRRTREPLEIKIVGIIQLGASGSFSGLHISEGSVARVFQEADLHRNYVRLVAGAPARDTAKEMEASLLATGAQAESLRYQVEQVGGVFRSFFYLMQGFMGLGLFVGVAAVGVIAFRTVVERRQQIGMLRALGYTRGMIGLTFLLESSFIALMGTLSGVVLALLLSYQLITEEFEEQGVATFLIPWTQVGIIAALAFGFALLMSVLPSRQAAGIPIAAALRYE